MMPLDEYDRALIASADADRPSTCTKVRYRDRKAAQTQINFLSHRQRQPQRPHRRGRRGRVKALRAYSCPECRAWHITKQV
jgi:hypothetical protein